MSDGYLNDFSVLDYDKSWNTISINELQAVFFKVSAGLSERNRAF